MACGNLSNGQGPTGEANAPRLKLIRARQPARRQFPWSPPTSEESPYAPNPMIPFDEVGFENFWQDHNMFKITPLLTISNLSKTLRDPVPKLLCQSSTSKKSKLSCSEEQTILKFQSKLLSYYQSCYRHDSHEEYLIPGQSAFAHHTLVGHAMAQPRIRRLATSAIRVSPFLAPASTEVIPHVAMALLQLGLLYLDLRTLVAPRKLS